MDDKSDGSHENIQKATDLLAVESDSSDRIESVSYCVMFPVQTGIKFNNFHQKKEKIFFLQNSKLNNKF